MHTNSAADYGFARFKSDSIFNTNFFAMMTDSQIVVYVKWKGAMDVRMKTAEKMRYLEMGEIYSDDELRQMQHRIYGYLMREKLVYLRDKYDIAKQKKNIQLLKATQPACLKEADSRRKMVINGFIDNGKILWRRTK